MGLVSRLNAPFVPAFFNEYAGDTLWALVVYLLIGLLVPRLASKWVALAALCFSFGIEASQLYHAPWIDALRRNRFGALVLGFGFLWSDLVCYSVGVALGVLMEFCSDCFSFSKKTRAN